MPQENIGFSQLFKANARSPQLPEIYIYRTNILQRTLTISGLFNLPIPVSIPDVCARLGVGRSETGGSIFPTCNSTSAPSRFQTLANSALGAEAPLDGRPGQRWRNDRYPAAHQSLSAKTGRWRVETECHIADVQSLRYNFRNGGFHSEGRTPVSSVV